MRRALPTALLTLAALAAGAAVQDPGGRLAGHPQLKDLGWQRADELAPLVVLVQPPLPADKVAGFHGPWLRRLEQVFRERLAEPAGLSASGEPPVLCLFADDLQWRRYANHEAIPRYPERYGTHDSRLGVSLACEGPRGASGADRRRPVLRAMAAALLASHYSGARGTLPREAWIALGLCDYLSFHTADSPDALAAPPIDPVHLGTLVEVVGRADLRSIYLPSLTEVVSARSFADVWPAVRARAEESRADDPLEDYASRVFHELLPLWMHFLLDGEKGRHRDAFLHYLKAAMQGNGGPSALDAAFSGASLEDVERAFLNWVYAQHRAAGLGNERGARAIEQLFEERAQLSEAVASALAAATPDPTRILPDPRDVSTSHAMALELAARGEYGQALAILEELWTNGRDGPHGERLGRELERMKQFVLLRDAFLVESIAKGRRLKLPVGGKTRSFKVLAVEEGIVRFDDRKKELPVIRVEDLDPHLLAQEMSKLTENYRPAEVPEWMRLYAYVLAGDSKWTKLLKDRSPAAEALRADRASYDVLVPTGAATRDLERIGARTLPLSEATAAETEEDIRALMANYGELHLVRERREPLLELARAAEEVLFELRGLRALFHGQCSELGNGRARILYPFEDPAELEDFEPDPGYLEIFRSTLPTLLTEDPVVEVAEEALNAVGATAYRHTLEFVAPVTVRWKIRYGYVTPEGSPAIHDFVAVCDDARENYAALTGRGGLVVLQKPGFHRIEHAESKEAFTPKQVFELELEHDGTVVTSRVDGEKVKEVPCGPRTSGRLLLFFHTDTPASIEELIIEGRVDPQARAALRDVWVGQRLSELGLGD